MIWWEQWELTCWDTLLTPCIENLSGTYEELSECANLPTLNKRRLQNIAVLVFQVKNGLVQDNVSALFVYAFAKEQYFYNTTFQHYHMYVMVKMVLLLDIFYGLDKLCKDIRDAPILTTFTNKFRKPNLSDYVTNNCCKLCIE